MARNKKSIEDGTTTGGLALAEPAGAAADDDREPGEDGEDGELAPDPEGKALFNREKFEREDLAIAKIDGNPVDRIALKFSGQVFLDRSEPNDVALYNKLSLGHDVTVMVEGKCASTGAQGATDRDGDLDVVVGVKGIKVSTVYIPAAAA